MWRSITSQLPGQSKIMPAQTAKCHVMTTLNVACSSMLKGNLNLTVANVPVSTAELSCLIGRGPAAMTVWEIHRHLLDSLARRHHITMGKGPTCEDTTPLRGPVSLSWVVNTPVQICTTRKQTNWQERRNEKLGGLGLISVLKRTKAIVHRTL